MSRYRVLRMITWLPMGGIERKIAAVLPRLDPELFEVHMCCIRERGPLADVLEAAGIPVHVVPFRSRLDPIALLRLRHLVKRLGIQLIHSHMYRSNVPATAMKVFDRNIRVIGHYHNVNTWETPRQLALDRFLAQRRNMNVAVSEAVRKDVQQRLGLRAELTTTLYNCVDLDEFHPLVETERLEVRQDLGLNMEHRVVLCVARLVPQKNQQLVLHCAPEILRSVPAAKFLFAGGGPDEELLKQLAQQLGIAGQVAFLGPRNDIHRLLAAADVAVLPSLKEGFSNAVLEAMACGTPMVASDVGGNREVIDHGDNGFLCDMLENPAGTLEVNSAQFVRHVKRLLLEEDVCERIGEAAHARAQHYGIDSMVREIEQLYLEVLED
ncbi:MAG: glycosyltransferase [Candidatus Sumerlaeaceae bacterium]